jgi:hypothetical protein
MTVAQLRRALRGLKGDTVVVFSINSTLHHGSDACPSVQAGLETRCPTHEQVELRNFHSDCEVGIAAGRVRCLRLVPSSRSILENKLDTWATVE